MTMTDYVHQAVNGETFDSIALAWYDNEKYAAELMCANPQYSDLTVFLGGEMLKIPWIDLPSEENNDSITEPAKAPWKE